MRTCPFLTTAVTAAVVCAAACGPGERGRAGGRDSLPTLSVSPSTPTGRIALDIWELRAGVMLTDWLAVHADDDIQPPVDSGPGARLGDWCLRAVRLTQLGAVTVERAAYFYPPPLTDSLVLPDSAPEMVRFCSLGAITSTVQVPDSATGSRLADSLRTVLSSAFGGGERDGRLVFYGSAFWSVRGRFRREGLNAVSALASVPLRPAAHAVFALAWLPPSRLSVDSVAVERTWMPPDADSIPFDTLLEWSGLPAAVRRELRQLRETALAFRDWENSPVSYLPSRRLEEILRRALAAAASLGAPRRAAALVAADRLLNETMCQHGLCHEETGAMLAPFRALGAQFTWAASGATWVYDRNWLVQARTLDRDSRLGQRILLSQLSSGFDFSGSCAKGAEAFRRVIQNGERYLARQPTSPIAQDVRLALADAYRDIVALAQGAGGEWADSSRYSTEAPAARRLALAHYRAVIAANPTHPAAEYAWRRAWRLAAGLPVGGTRYLCVTD